MSTLFALLLLCLVGLPQIALGYTHLHHGSGGSNSPRYLRGRIRTNSAYVITKNDGTVEVEDKNDGSEVVDFKAMLKRDVVVCEELEQDNVSIESCSLNPRTRKASLVLTGKMLDTSDYKEGVAFSIESDDWEKKCGKVGYVPGIDTSDDYYFFIMDHVRTYKNKAFIKMTIVPGSEVVPEIEFNIENTPHAAEHMPKKLMFDDDPAYGSTTRYLETVRLGYGNDTLHAAARPSISESKTIELFPSATLTVGAKLSADFKDFKLRRSFKVKVEWTQVSTATVNAGLKVDLSNSGSKRGNIFNKPIPGIGYSFKIPFVGRLRIGAFAQMEWLVEASLSGGVDAQVTASYMTQQRIKAQLLPPRISSSSLAAETGSGKSSIDFDSTIDPEFIGFAGVRPGLGAKLTIGRKGFENIIGADLGVQAITGVKKPAYEPFSGSGKTVGKCDKCHFVRGSISVLGKNLSTDLFENGKLEKQKVIKSSFLNIPLGTLCALATVCPAA